MMPTFSIRYKVTKIQGIEWIKLNKKKLNKKIKIKYRIWKFTFGCYVNTNVDIKGVGMIRVDFGPISETVSIDIILNTIIER